MCGDVKSECRKAPAGSRRKVESELFGMQKNAKIDWRKESNAASTRWLWLRNEGVRRKENGRRRTRSS